MPLPRFWPLSDPFCFNCVLIKVKCNYCQQKNITAPSVKLRYRPDPARSVIEDLYSSEENPSPMLSLLEELYAIHAIGVTKFWVKDEKEISSMKLALQVCFSWKNCSLTIIFQGNKYKDHFNKGNEKLSKLNVFACILHVSLFIGGADVQPWCHRSPHLRHTVQQQVPRPGGSWEVRKGVCPGWLSHVYPGNFVAFPNYGPAPQYVNDY